MKRAPPVAALALRKAGVIVLRPGAGGWRCLVLRAYRNWGLPKGEIEAGEIPLATAVRETKEETSLDDLEFRWGEVFIDTLPRTGHKRARYYVAVSSGARVLLPVSPELGRPEHDEFRWTSFSGTKALLAPALHPLIEWAAGIVATAHAPRQPEARRRGPSPDLPNS